MNTIILVILSATPFTGFADVQPVRRETRFSHTLNDIESHVPEGRRIGEAGMYRDRCKVTHAHEMMHAACSRWRNIGKTQYKLAGALYLGDGKAFAFDRVSVRLRNVANQVPMQWRDSHYRLYMVQQQQGWNDYPWMILEECITYLTGAKVGIEYGMKDRTRQSLERAALQFRYATIFEKMSNNASVAKFNKWYLKELLHYIEEARKRGCRVGTVSSTLATVGVNTIKAIRVTEQNERAIDDKDESSSDSADRSVDDYDTPPTPVFNGGAETRGSVEGLRNSTSHRGTRSRRTWNAAPQHS